jgi:hypothetical protein
MKCAKVVAAGVWQSVCGVRGFVALGIAISAHVVTLNQATAQQALACPREVVTCCRFTPVTEVVREAARPIETGFQLWPIDIAAAPALATELAPDVVRFSIGPYWRNLPPLPFDASLDAVRTYVKNGMAEHRQKWVDGATALRKLSPAGGGPKELLIIWEPPLTPLESLDLRKPNTYRVISTEAITSHARFYLATIENARALGYRVDMVEIANEPDGSWNMKIPPAAYAMLLSRLRSEATAAGVQLPLIVGPGLASLKSNVDYFGDRETAARILANIDIVSVHAWDDRKGHNIVEEARAVRALFDRLGWIKPIMVSEFAPTFPRPEDRAAKRGPDQRVAADKRDVLVNDLPRYAPSTLELFLSFAALGYGPLIYWEFKDQSWGSMSYGLVDKAGRPRPAYEAWRHLVGELRRNEIDTVRASVRSGRSSGQIFGLFKGDTFKSVVVLNAQDDPFTLRLNDTRLAGVRRRQALPSADANAVVARASQTCGSSPRRSGLIVPPASVTTLPTR